MRFPLLLVALLGCSAPPDASAPAPPTALDRGPPGSPPGGQPGVAPPSDGRRNQVGRLSLSPDEVDSIQAACALEPKLPTGAGYDGLLHDAHVHSSLAHDQGPFAVDLLAEMNAAGVATAIVQPDHAPGMRTNRQFKGALRRMERTWGQIGALCPRLRVMLYVFDPDDPSEWAYVDESLATGHFSGVGEIELQHSRLPLKADPHSPLMERIYDRLEADGGLLHFQASPRGERDPLPDQIVAIARAHPGARFLWFAAEAPPQPDWPENLKCSAILHPVMGGLPDNHRILTWGSDVGPAGYEAAGWAALPYRSIAEAAAGARALLGELPPEASARVAYGNLEGLLNKP